MPLNPIQPLPFFSTEANHQILSHSHLLLIFLSLTAAVSFYISFQRRPASSAFFPNSLFVRQVFFFGTITDQCGDSLYYIQPLFIICHLPFAFTTIIIYHLRFTFYHVYHLLLTTYIQTSVGTLSTIFSHPLFTAISTKWFFTKIFLF